MSSRSCAWVLLFGMTACALPPGMTVMRTAGKAGPALELEAIAVAEPEVTLLGVEPWHRWQRARDVLRVVEQRPAVDAVAPWEFDAVTRPTTPGGYATRTTLLRRARELGIDPKKVAVLEIQAMEGATGQVVEATRKAELRLHREYRSDVQLTVRLVHPATDAIIARYELELPEDRFVDVPESDPRPQISAAITEATGRLLDVLLARDAIAFCAPPLLQEGAETAPQVRENPRLALEGTDVAAALERRLKGLDTLEHDAFTYAVMRASEPDLTLRDLRALRSTPLGVRVVMSAGPPTVQETWVEALRRPDGSGAWPTQTSFAFRRAWRRGARQAAVWRAGERALVDLRTVR